MIHTKDGGVGRKVSLFQQRNIRVGVFKLLNFNGEHC